MKITEITGGVVPTNCYLLTDDATGDTAVIDPGFESPELTKAVMEAGAGKVKAILLTHGHFDHILGVNAVKELTNAVVYLYSDDVPFTSDNSLNLSTAITSQPVQAFKADVVLNDGDTIKLGSLKIRVLHTPGHTIGSCCFVVEDAIFTGDTLMQCSCGRTDFPTGSYTQMLQSLKRLENLKGDYHIYPGHESETTLEFERKNNPFMGNSAYDPAD
ncbi:MBL fold metallo-hydrolase [Caproiciproducens galactitolivorans]|uniref:MBL fold metallo-hydrolase n=1 Tax=Caproiciproducens galactitolivorans TaxID=642589 RepID=A0ABT4BQI3_9FIRM|nr:MBL fold metallo-hydrolase [Caproiciproducens galactitolivorans]MCY1713162.1 MBL fold metallo-hydrolase [Caproiciproducens galactitolivorans]